MENSSNTPSLEYHLIKSITECLKFSGKSSFRLGIGDDAALRICKNQEQLIFTADILVENVHFSLEYMSLEEVGYKAMVANISDCAAMASIPDSAMIQLVFPKNNHNKKEDILKLYEGINRASVEYDFPIIGGDLSSGNCWTIGVSMTGRKDSGEKLLFRKGANIGDNIWVTDTLGGSAAGLEILNRYGKREKYLSLIKKHVCPKARVNEALRLSEDATVTTLTDISDGIGKECNTLAYENDVAIEIKLNESLLLPDIIKFGNEINENPYNWAISGGEDYELLFSASPEFKKEKYADLSLINIGKIVKSGYGLSFVGSIIDPFLISKSGWDHFNNQ